MTPVESPEDAMWADNGKKDAFQSQIELNGFKAENPYYWQALLNNLAERGMRLWDDDKEDFDGLYHRLTTFEENAKKRKLTLVENEQAQDIINQILQVLERSQAQAA